MTGQRPPQCLVACDIPQPAEITKAVVEAARESLVIGEA